MAFQLLEFGNPGEHDYTTPPHWGDSPATDLHTASRKNQGTQFLALGQKTFSCFSFCLRLKHESLKFLVETATP